MLSNENPETKRANQVQQMPQDKFLKIELRLNVPNFINESIIHNTLPLPSSSIIMREFGAAVCMI